jgi:hypothetical protein
MPASLPGINPDGAVAACGSEPVTADCGCLQAFLARARDLQSRCCRKRRSRLRKMRFVEKTSKSVLTPEAAVPYKPPIETATPLAAPLTALH